MFCMFFIKFVDYFYDMKKTGLILILGFLLINLCINAQQNKIDSLLQQLEQVPEQDKAEIYNQLAVFNTKNSPGLRIEYGKKALDIALKYELKEEKLHSLSNIATGYAYSGDNLKALEYDLKALDMAKELNNNKFLSNIFSNLGYDYYYLGNFEKSLECNLNALAIRNEMLETGLPESEKNLASSYNNIGSLYNSMGQHQKALEYFQKGLDIGKKLGDSIDIGQSLHNIGSIYEKLKESDKALDYYQDALEIRKKYGNKREIAETLNNLGIIMKHMNFLDKALEYLFESIQIFSEINNKGGATSVTNNIAGIYLLQKNPERAYPYIIKGIELAEETGQKKTLSEIYVNLVDYYVLIGDYKNAFKTQEKFLILKDTLYSTNLAEKVSEMQTKYETERKEKEISLLTKDNEIQSLKIRKQSIQLYLLITVVLVVVLIGSLLFSRYKLKQKHYHSELEKKNLETEQRLLRSQMNPHFIFNSLNSIQSYISGNNALTAMTYLSKFAKLMRYILENSRKKMISLEDEVNTLQLYIELERIRFKQKFDFIIEIDPKLQPETTYIPPMLIQPFVENSIKHGLRNIKEQGHLQLNFKSNHEVIFCSINDNGIGRDQAQKLNKDIKGKHKSLGMHLTKERLEALNSESKSDIKVEIIDLKNEKGEPAGTEVQITLPFEIE